MSQMHGSPRNCRKFRHIGRNTFGCNGLKGKMMAVTLRHCRSRRVGLCLAATVILGTGFGAVQPAWADGDNFFSPVLGMIGMGNNDKHDPVKANGIDYSPRAPLVVPPTRDLPPPQPRATRGANWPNDPDASMRRKAEADSRRPAPQVVSNQPVSGPIKVRMNDCVPGQCPDDSFWDKVKATFTLSQKQDVVLSGVEPNRDYLIDPPSGYRRPLPLSEQPVAAQPQPAKTTPTEQQGPTGAKFATSDVAKVPPTVDPQAEASVLSGITGQGQQPTAGQPPAQPAQKDHWGLW
jgi:hypothetical protein